MSKATEVIARLRKEMRPNGYLAASCFDVDAEDLEVLFFRIEALETLVHNRNVEGIPVRKLGRE